MEEQRQRQNKRARNLLPSIVITVLSMIQAIALELFWGKVVDAGFLWEGSWDSMIGWLQVATGGLEGCCVGVLAATNTLKFNRHVVSALSVLSAVVVLGWGVWAAVDGEREFEEHHSHGEESHDDESHGDESHGDDGHSDEDADHSDGDTDGE